MDDETARALNRVNVAFYRRHGAAFSAKRERPWQGWSRLLPWIPERPLAVLDAGCGNGRFGRFLAAHRPLSRYVGVDASDTLLAIARSGPPEATTVTWLECDFVAIPPDRALPPPPFDLCVLFGVLHGVPGEARRRALVEACARRLAPGGLLVFTCWRFRADRRLLGRVAAPDAAPRGVDPARLSADDHWLRWGDGDDWRYAAHIGAAERARWLAGLDLARVAEFRADGPGGDLNHYTVVRRRPDEKSEPVV